MSKRRRRTSGKVKKSKTQLNAAKQAIKQGNLDKAILILQSLKGQIDEQKRMIALAELYFRRAHRYAEQRPEQAQDDFEHAVKLRENDVIYKYHLALFQQRQAQSDAAIANYRTILEQDADFERAALSLAFALQASGNVPQQDPVWKQLPQEHQALFTEDAVTSNALTKALIAGDNQQWEQAIEHLMTVIKNDNKAHVQALAHDYLGRFLLQNDPENLQTALSHWRTAYQLGSRSETFVNNLALAYTLHIEGLIVHDDTTTALEYTQEAIQIFPEHTRLQDIQAHLLLRVGYNEAIKHNWQSALNYWDKVENAEGEVARRLVANKAIAHEKLEAWGAAADSWREFARRRGRKEGAVNYLSPDQVARLWSRISNLYMRVEREEDAITTLQTALKYDPDDLDMSIDLARRYAEAGRFEASQNQIDRVVKKHPQSAKAYAFKAEVADIAPRGWGLINTEAIESWEKVIDLNDDSFDAYARQQLQQSYLEAFARLMNFSFNPSQPLSFAREKLDKFPDFHLFRADFAGALMNVDSADEVIQEQIDLLDLTNEPALLHIMVLCHVFERDALAKTILQRADDLGAVTFDFYGLIAHNVLQEGLTDIGIAYFEEGQKHAPDDEKRQNLRLLQASTYVEVGMYDEGEAVLKEMLAQDPDFGPAQLTYAMLYLNKGNSSRTKFYLSKAEKWAQAHNHSEMLQIIESMRFQLDNPLASLLPPGFDPSLLPPGMDVEDVLNALGFDDDFDYFDDDDNDEGEGYF